MDQVQQVREKIDIVDLISEHISLKQVGHNFKANCPFHQEKSPSFVVSPERQIWHCFGCGLGGDAFSFLMQYEKLEFPEALRILAKRVGVQLTETSEFTTKISSKKDLLYTINHLVAQFYHYILTTHTAGEKAKDYLVSRSIDPKIMATFQIGYSPATGNALTAFLLKKGYQKQDLFDAGLSTMRQGRVQDFFVNRLMFPLYDHRDNIVGFSGRICGDIPAFGPKYVNTKETMIYHKGSHFFGLNVTKQEIKQKEQAIVVEGEFDVMRCFAAGIGNVVGLKGTALTEEQVSLLSRFTKKVTLCLDTDEAGQQAMVRSLPLLSRKELMVTVIAIPDGHDPDEAILTNEFGFKQAVKHDIDVYDYLLTLALTRHDAQTAEGKKRISSSLLPVYETIDNAIVREHYLRKLSGALETSYESIEKEIARRSQKQIIRKIAETTIPQDKKSRQEKMTEHLISLTVQFEPVAESLEAIQRILSSVTIPQDVYGRILSHMLGVQFMSVRTIQDVTKDLPTELLPVFDTCYLLPLPNFLDKSKYKEELIKTAHHLRSLFLKERLKVLTKMVQEEPTSENEERALQLQKEYALLTTQLKESERQ